MSAAVILIIKDLIYKQINKTRIRMEIDFICFNKVGLKIWLFLILKNSNKNITIYSIFIYLI